MRALIFDCDGVLADTERDGHRVAFNQAFAEFDVPLAWGEDDYGAMLAVGGGKERIGAALTPAFATAHGLPRDEAGLTALIARLHARKTEIYREIVASGSLSARPGVVRLATEAFASGWRIAVASTSAEASVRAVIDTVMGNELASQLSAILAGDIVPRKKPAPDIYELALTQLGVDASSAIAIEDSRNGLLSALAARIPCVVTLTDYTASEKMAGASLVLTSLGDPGEPAQVIANPTLTGIGEIVTLADLDTCVSGGPR